MGSKSPKKPKPAGKGTPPDSGEVASSNPKLVSNVMLADIVMRMGTSVLRKGVETTFLRGKYGKDTAKALVHERSFGRSIATMAIAKIGSKSLPGAALVGGGLVIKALFDRSRARQAARRNVRKATRKADQGAD